MIFALLKRTNDVNSFLIMEEKALAKSSRPTQGKVIMKKLLGFLLFIAICFLCEYFGLIPSNDEQAPNETTVEVSNNVSESNLPFVEDPFDSDGTLKESVRYKTGEYEYYYETDEEGRIVLFETDDLQLTTREERLPHDGNTPGKIKGDHAGHLAGDRFGGSPHIDNLVSQSSKVNLSTYKKMENAWASALEEGKEVTVEVEVIYTDDDMRPDEFDVEYTIDGEYFTQHLLNQ